ncbi:MAG: DUF3048 C-terminal domain-containing protein, partial [Candidatus Magasanikiibacteriota bacterium]
QPLNHSTTSPQENIQAGGSSKNDGSEVVRWSGGQVVSEITVSFLSPVYEAVWKYNTTTNQYERFQMNKPHVDQDGRKIVADNVIVQKVTAKVLDEIGRQEITTVGKGELLVFKNNEVITGYWQKNDSSSRTKFFDNSGEEIKLTPGKIWVEVVSQMNSLSFRTNDSE